MSIFDQTTLSERKRRAELRIGPFLQPGDVALFVAGEPIQKPGGLDQTYPFLPHPDYFWLSGLRTPFGVVAFSTTTGSVDFVKYQTLDERIWDSAAEVVEGHDVKDLENWLQKNKFKRVFMLGQPNAQQKQWSHNDVKFATDLQELFNEARREKDAAEIELIKSCAQAAHAGYVRLQNFIRPGVSERQIQLVYENEVLHAGSEKFPYDTIVGSGPNSAVLHATPTSRIVQKGEMILIDAGADIQDYCVDITRVFAADGVFTQQQQSIYDLVAKAQTEAIRQCLPNTEWHDVHRTAARVIATGLKELGLMTGEVDSLLETGAVSIFLPHGIGHMVGHRVRDVGGRAGTEPAMCCGVRVRVNLPMKENYLMTVEPGIYFNPVSMDHQEYREKYKDHIRWQEVEKWRGFGGIRIEDDILITSKGPKNLTALVHK